MFSLSKILGFFALPSNLLFALACGGVLLMATRWRRLGQGLAVGAVLGLAAFGFSPAGNLLIHPLEQRFPAGQSGGAAPDGIVVLGGAVSPDVSERRGQPALNEAAERMTAVAKLARDYPHAKIVFTGGSNSLFSGASEAHFVADLFESFGISRDRLILEDRARNTHENAVFTKRLADPKPGQRWLLVTSAAHMPRSVGLFRKAGFAVEAHPVDFRTRGRDDLTAPFGSLAAGLARSDAAMHEWAGLLASWLRGHTDALFPAP